MMSMKPAVWMLICAVRVGLADETHAPGNKEGRNELRPSRRRGASSPLTLTLLQASGADNAKADV